MLKHATIDRRPISIVIFSVVLIALIALSQVPGRVAAEDQEYTVQPGDTLSSIAAQFDVTVGRIVFTNEIEDANVIAAGRVIVIPDPGAPAIAYYSIVQGDWLSRIARDFGSSVEALLAANGLTDKDLIFPEQKLIIPVGDGTGVAAIDDGLAGADAFYTVEPGDTLRAIAAEFDTSLEAIVAANEIEEINLIFVGQRLILPTG